MTREEAIKTLQWVFKSTRSNLYSEDVEAIKTLLTQHPTVEEIVNYCKENRLHQLQFLDDDHCRGAAGAYWNVEHFINAEAPP